VQNHVIYPADALSSWIADGLRRRRDILFTVAYWDVPGVEAVLDALKKRLERPRARVRILFQDHAFLTEPEAIRRVLGIRRGRAGTLELRYAGKALRRFHSKAYGFRGAQRTEVLLGSSNATGKALGPDSGEMNVYLSGRIAEAAWSVMDHYWSEGQEVNRAWLKRYARAHARYQELAAAANALVERWRGPSKPRLRYRPWNGRVTVEHTYPFSKDEERRHRSRLKAAKDEGVEVPAKYIAMTGRNDAFEIARAGEVLDVFWRAPGDVDRGLHSMGFIRVGGVQRVGNARLGTRWLVGYSDVRGTRIRLQRRHARRVEAVLRRHGYSYGTFAGVSGRIRGRKELMKAVYVDLQRMLASEKRRER
jgi:HKD family nuclease